jgi:8-oxo-dGTP pyrophosphatase MutT (NUDIX family)
MSSLQSLADFAAEAEAGVGLAVQDEAGRYLFHLAGTRHHCPPGELFYAGIGGHREPGEDWLACAQREALEEVGTGVDILHAPATWHLPQGGPVRQVAIRDEPRPLALYEMVHPPGTPRAGDVYRIVVYRARLCGPPRNLPPDEVLGVIALTPEQVVQGPDRRPTLAQLLAEGARIVAGAETVDRETRLYPLGTAQALAQVLQRTGLEASPLAPTGSRTASSAPQR